MDKKQLAQKIMQVAHLTGEFKLRSGQISNEYFDKYRFEARPELLKPIAKHMATLIPIGTQVLAGLEMGGIPVATAVSFETGLPVVFVRKEAKDYGTCKLVEGYDVQNKKVCIIEDVVTTGGAVIDATHELRNIGAHIHEVVCVINRNNSEPEKLIQLGLKTLSLFTMDELKNRL